MDISKGFWQGDLRCAQAPEYWKEQVYHYGIHQEQRYVHSDSGYSGID